MRNKNAKPLIALALTGAASALVVAFRVPDGPVVGNAISVVSNTSAGAGVAATKAANTPSTATSKPDTTSGPVDETPVATGTSSSEDAQTAKGSQYANGTYTGSAVDEPWGTFQVQVTISNGQIADVTVVSEPDDGHSGRINRVAVPILTESAIAAQSSAIDMVSGATWTSESYTTSLQAALDAAAAAESGG